ncbi:hypothetical protein J120_04690 [candidate division TM6 bacterium JCVI TM6SC1]|uniref:Thyroglobulin type-1 domain-containing protein n=1 Tax=candidate division TM6 bacterium JCVI TM6SC1 TaxID=1306947 RepID=A0A0D2I198_9BACT|nr:hypothetical protein J120_04690 [candidate division TM6 bacterium JCVI TM6SC1]
MLYKKLSLLLIVSVLLSSNISYTAGDEQCSNEQTCTVSKSCKCYCSRICEFREKKPEDKCVYVENDPNGKYCYCKEWDRDNYKDRCEWQQSTGTDAQTSNAVLPQ